MSSSQTTSATYSGFFEANLKTSAEVKKGIKAFPAEMPQRIVAFFIDVLILGNFVLITLIAGFFTGNIVIEGEGYMAMLMGLSFLFFNFVAFFYFSWFHAVSGQTPGKMITRIKVESISGEIPSAGRSFFRSIGYLLSSSLFFVGFLWAFIDENYQTWHDKLAGTFVIKTDL